MDKGDESVQAESNSGMTSSEEAGARMSDHIALEKHSCPACGARAEWNPGQQALVCPYCGTVSPYELDPSSGVVEEIDLVTALRELPEELRGWESIRRTVRCRSCDAVSVFDPERVGQNCDFCGSPELVDYDEIKSPIRPLSLLPFQIPELDAKDLLRRWFGTKWLAPGSFKKAAFFDTIRGIYLPFWTFDAQVSCSWHAESGTYYYENKQVRGNDVRVTTQRVRRTRWSRASGHVDHAFDDEPIPGTQGIERDLLQSILPYPTQNLIPYDTAYLSGFVVEHYRVVLLEAAKLSRDSMNSQLRQLCGRDVPGDTYRNLQIAPDYSGETFKHILVPAWLLTYQYRRQSYQVLINGYTGKVAGKYPKSFWKMFFIVLVAILVLVVVAYLS